MNFRSTTRTKSSRPTSLLAIDVFVISFALYVFTLAPGLLWGGGDFATFQTRLYTREIDMTIFGHPLWVVVAHPFVWLPIGDVAYRANLAAAFFASSSLLFVFLSAVRITRAPSAALLATFCLMVSHTFWTYAVMPKPYSLNALLLSACIYLLIRWSQEKHAWSIWTFAALYGLSPLNHLLMLTAAAGFLAFVLLTARRLWTERHIRFHVVFAGLIFVAVASFYFWVISRGDHSESTIRTVLGFLSGFITALSTPTLLFLGIALGAALWFYQYAATIPVGIVGLAQSLREDTAVAWMLALVALGDIAFLLSATDPRAGGVYVWNLHYYLPTYIIFALWIAYGFAARWEALMRTVARKIAVVTLSLGLPISIYIAAPIAPRPFLATVPGFRELPGRDNLTYVLSPWKHTEIGARSFGESILRALPMHATLFADYSIWSMVNYLQVVEEARPDVGLIMLPGPGDGKQVGIILAQHGGVNLFLADINHYYELAEIRRHFEIVPAGPVYKLVAK